MKNLSNWQNYFPVNDSEITKDLFKFTAQRNCSKQLQTDNLPTGDVENIRRTNTGRDLLLANKPRIIP